MERVSTLLAFCLVACIPSTEGHGNMINPMPRSGHNQVYDDKNKCGCENTPGGCYSNATSPGYYCGIGCIGEACLYYQIGCFQSCPECSYVGKTLYPVPEDLVKAGNCPTPPEPTLGGGDPVKERELRTYNVDGASHFGDWTKWNPWRSPGTAGKGNPRFQPCGVNSGSNPSFPDPPSAGQPQFANGTDLPPLPKDKWSTWKAGSVVEATWSIYANHGGGYSYRLCRVEDGETPTEACFQSMPLDFATETTEIRYVDGSRDPFFINATTTSEGTWPTGSQWRKNPIPMCNCDLGFDCSDKSTTMTTRIHRQLSSGKECKAVTKDQCGDKTGYNTCLKCGDKSTYDCEECCDGLTRVEKDGYAYCVGKSPSSSCSDDNPRACYGVPYPDTYVAPGQDTSPLGCPTGLMFPSQWNEGYGQGNDGRFVFSMTDKLKVPDHLEPGTYSLSWRWDCEQTPQVWNSCADVIVEN